MLYPHGIKANKEDNNMKATTVKYADFRSMPQIPYPNAATRKELLHKFLDLVLVGAIGAGLAACLILVAVLG